MQKSAVCTWGPKRYMPSRLGSRKGIDPLFEDSQVSVSTFHLLLCFLQ